MGLKEIKEAKKQKKIIFGLKQILKFYKQKKRGGKVFVASDAREETMKRLENERIKFEVLKTKSEIAKELNLGFESEVLLIR